MPVATPGGTPRSGSGTAKPTAENRQCVLRAGNRREVTGGGVAACRQWEAFTARNSNFQPVPETKETSQSAGISECAVMLNKGRNPERFRNLLNIIAYSGFPAQTLAPSETPEDHGSSITICTHPEDGGGCLLPQTNLLNQ